MGSFDSIFGGGMSTPDLPEETPMPAESVKKDAESAAVRDEERRRLRARKTMGGTILTSPLGTGGSSGSRSGMGLLGRNV